PPHGCREPAAQPPRTASSGPPAPRVLPAAAPRRALCLSTARKTNFGETDLGQNGQHYDAIVIGCGPAGSSASAILAAKGRRVLVLEREKFPRYHIGESLIPYTYFPLERMGLIDKMK